MVEIEAKISEEIWGPVFVHMQVLPGIAGSL